MKVTAHLKELQNKHAQLEEKIKRELKRARPDTLLLTTLKKQKLKLKDRISAAQLA